MNIKCPKCGRADTKIVSNPEDSSVPMYKCGQCGNQSNIFPQMGNANKKTEETTE